MTKRVPRTRNNEQWTEARFRAFIKGGLRQISNRWPPKANALKNARVERGVYMCAGYKKRKHKVPVSIEHNGKRIRNVAVDHINPVIDPEIGFVSWDEVVKRMFVEADQLQILCKDCHDRKTADERKKKNV